MSVLTASVVIRGVARRRTYRDSIELMGLAAQLEGLPGVGRAAVLMGTPANREMIAAAGLAFDGLDGAAADDLLIVVAAEDGEAADDALARAGDLLAAGAPAVGTAAGAAPMAPPSLGHAIAALSTANLALVSTPGPFAAAEAFKALKRGLNVFLFSDNVSLEHENELKALASARGLLVMGPDCGAAIVGGVPLGFANAVRRGSIGLVAASGTGLQQVTCLIDRLGGGISHALGVGGRDLSAAVGAASTLRALDLLGADPGTERIVLISKPPSPAVAERVLAAAVATGKPVVACFVGGSSIAARPSVTLAATLEDAAHLAIESPLPEGKETRAEGSGDGAPAGSRKGHVRGLFAGGTFAYEAAWLLSQSLGDVAHVEHGEPGDLTGHAVVDLGGDAFTVGRALPMIDPRPRADWIAATARDSSVGVLLLDVVLGYGAHPDPAGALLPTLAEARAAGIALVASVCGTAADPQRLPDQEAKLRDVGVTVAPSSSAAARLAAHLAMGQT